MIDVKSKGILKYKGIIRPKLEDILEYCRLDDINTMKLEAKIAINYIIYALLFLFFTVPKLIISTIWN